MPQKGSMAKKSQARRKKTTASRRRSPRKARGGNVPTNLKQTLYSIGLWGLGIVNAVFIFSMVMKYVPTDGEQPINAMETVAQQTATASIRLEILNGCGATGIGKKFADYLRVSGYTPVNVDNYSSFDMPNTIILDRRSINTLLGLRVAETLGLPASAVLYQARQNPAPADADADVTIVIGKDYARIGFLQNSPSR